MTFVKGQSGNPAGRKVGALEHNTRILRHAAIMAAEIAGGGGEDGLVTYLVTQAQQHPVAFLGFLAKAMPLQIEAKGDNHIVIEVVRVGGDDSKVINGHANGKTNGSADTTS